MSHSLFSVFGIEIEYAIIRKENMQVDASVDKLIQALSGNPDNHPSFGNVETDNELAAHVLELKCLKPSQDWVGQAKDFAAAVKIINGTLGQWNTRLLPGGMHPFMDPTKESVLWPHEDGSIYQAYDRIFGCRGHGWFNIQSVHLNLPFANDAEFSQLHNAISLLLPLLPAMAAASPIFDGQHNGWLDSRLFHYVGNQRRLPSIIGGIIPEPVGSEEEYQEKILRPMYREIAPLDPDHILQEEWLNSRAAIARFDRGAIEIRCLDTQERPLADMALCHWVTSVLRMMLELNQDFLALHRHVPESLLKTVFLETAHYGMAAKIPEGYPIGAFGLEFKERPRTARDLLEALTKRVRSWSQPQSQSQSQNQSQNHFPILSATADAYFKPAIDLILERGNLSERILQTSFGAGNNLKNPSPELYASIYSRLGDCLELNEPFLGLT